MTTNKALIYFFTLIGSILGPCCKTIPNAASHREIYKSIYMDQFKLTYFRQILSKGFNNSKAIQEIINTDHSGFTEPVLTIEDYKLIDSLTMADNQKMQLDSTINIGKVAEGAEGKRILGFILDKINRKWLDSLADKRYKSSGIKQMHNE